MRKILIRTEGEGTYFAWVEKNLEDFSVQLQIAKALKSRRFAWFYIDELLELKLK